VQQAKRRLSMRLRPGEARLIQLRSITRWTSGDIKLGAGPIQTKQSLIEKWMATASQGRETLSRWKAQLELLLRDKVQLAFEHHAYEASKKQTAYRARHSFTKIRDVDVGSN